MKTAATLADSLLLQSGPSAETAEISTIFEQETTGAEVLMPYEAAAKAIFVKANGLSAYYKATGIVGRDE